MNPLNIVVPFSVFNEYRDRRSPISGDGVVAATALAAAGAVPSSRDDSGCADTAPAAGETAARAAALAEPTTERIPS